MFLVNSPCTILCTCITQVIELVFSAGLSVYSGEQEPPVEGAGATHYRGRPRVRRHGARLQRHRRLRLRQRQRRQNGEFALHCSQHLSVNVVIVMVMMPSVVYAIRCLQYRGNCAVHKKKKTWSIFVTHTSCNTGRPTGAYHALPVWSVAHAKCVKRPLERNIYTGMQRQAWFTRSVGVWHFSYMGRRQRKVGGGCKLNDDLTCFIYPRVGHLHPFQRGGPWVWWRMASQPLRHSEGRGRNADCVKTVVLAHLVPLFSLYILLK